MEEFKVDCKFFKGDRPCVFHKKEGIFCHNCFSYEQIKERILIIKLDAIGDVLRTTSILPALQKKYPKMQVTWITKSEAVPLFDNNKYIDRVFDLSMAPIILATDRFDRVINLDAAPLSARLASMANAKDKLGYLYHKNGYVHPTNKEAKKWFGMGLSDIKKKENKKTYQVLALEIAKLSTEDNSEPIFALNEDEKSFAKDYYKRNNLDGKIVIGFNTGSGGRWENKKWVIDNYLKLAELLKKKVPNCRILLFGGPEEADRNNYLKEKMPDLIDTGCNNTVRQFGALVDLCGIMVTGDTLAMHIAIALKKKVVVLFGPTSSYEIDIYGRGERIVPNIDCVVCYKNTCKVNPNCMQLIRSKDVLDAIVRCLNKK
jgi:heptosyltransferase-2